MNRGFSPEAFGFGVFLATVGLVFLLSNLGLVEAIPLLKKIWPGFLVVWGVAEIMAATASSGRSGGAE
ncbi:MAG: hypothetical protein JJE39_16035 [Vicinamibacteria bacterium]|nr:hypothetical protein [Vicinamibacteria bacterium]